MRRTLGPHSSTGGRDIAADFGALVARRASGWSTWAGRPTLVALAAMNAITGVVVAVLLAPVAAGADAGFYRDCALSGGAQGCGSLYPPLAAMVAWPLTLLSPVGAALLMSAIGVSILLAGVLLETRGLAAIDRMLVLVAAAGFAPVVHELLLGQITFPLAAAVYLVARRSDGYRHGIPLGIALAIAPKPLLVPILGWMLIRRRRALAGAAFAATLLTMAAVLVAGTAAYGAWLSILLGLGRDSVAGTAALSTHGNLSIWPLDLPRLVVALAVLVGAVWCVLRDEARGFVAAILAGLVLSPYTGLYAGTILLIAVRPALGFAPRATRVLALGANICFAMLTALVPWAALGVLAAAWPRRAGASGWPRGAWRLPPIGSGDQ